MERGQLVPDEITIGMLLARLEAPDAIDGAILDGFPRNRPQAEALDAALADRGSQVDRALHIQVPLDELVRRLSGRWICRDAGHVYHEQSNPPRVAGQCDLDGSPLIQRDDDKPDTIRARLTGQLDSLAQVVDHYRETGVLQRHRRPAAHRRGDSRTPGRRHRSVRGGGVAVVTRKSRAEIEKMRRAGRIVGEVLDIIEAELAPGVSTAHLDELAEAHIRRSGAIPSFKGYPGANPRRPFPASVCISLDQEIVHGIPGERTIKDGQIVSVDAGAILDGWHGDGARTFFVGDPPPAVRDLIAATEAAMLAGIAAAVPGNHIEDISAAVEDVALPYGFGIIRQFVGHGIGTEMHEEPQVPNYRTGRAGRKLEPGLCLAIEPMFTLGRHEAFLAPGRLDRRHARRVDGRPLRAHHRGDRVRAADPDPLVRGRRLPGWPVFDTLRVRVSARAGRHCA